MAELKNFETPSQNRVYIKIPPSLPFYESKVYSFLRKNLNQQIKKNKYTLVKEQEQEEEIEIKNKKEKEPAVD